MACGSRKYQRIEPEWFGKGCFFGGSVWFDSYRIRFRADASSNFPTACRCICGGTARQSFEDQLGFGCSLVELSSCKLHDLAWLVSRSGASVGAVLDQSIGNPSGIHEDE